MLSDRVYRSNIIRGSAAAVADIRYNRQKISSVEGIFAGRARLRLRSTSKNQPQAACLRILRRSDRLSPGPVAAMNKEEKDTLSKCCENNQAPAPGWALDQMSRLTVSRGDLCGEIADRLLKKTTDSSTNVKLKALRAIHFIGRRGSVHFRRSCCHRMEEIRVHLRES